MKQAIAIDLDQLKLLLKEFIAERGGDDQLLQQLTLSEFLLWAQRKVERDGEETRPDSRVQGVL